LKNNISYAILVNDEYLELARLLHSLYDNIDVDDEIIVVLDSTEGRENYNKNKKLLLDSLLEIQESGLIKFYEHPLKNNFARQKNFLNSMCTKEYIFNIDADEYPQPALFAAIKQILTNDTIPDAIWVPRVNVVENITVIDIEN